MEYARPVYKLGGDQTRDEAHAIDRISRPSHTDFIIRILNGKSNDNYTSGGDNLFLLSYRLAAKNEDYN